MGKKCTLSIKKDAKYVVAKGQIGELGTARIALANRGEVPTVQSISGVDVGSTLSKKQVVKALDKLTTFHKASELKFLIGSGISPLKKTIPGLMLTSFSKLFSKKLIVFSLISI